MTQLINAADFVAAKARLVLLLSCLTALACNAKPPPGAEATETKAEGDKASEPAKADDNSIPAPPDVKAPPADAEKTASGLATKVLSKGTGDKKPQVQDKVRVHY